MGPNPDPLGIDPPGNDPAWHRPSRKRPPGVVASGLSSSSRAAFIVSSEVGDHRIVVHWNETPYLSPRPWQWTPFPRAVDFDCSPKIHSASVSKSKPEAGNCFVQLAPMNGRTEFLERLGEMLHAKQQLASRASIRQLPANAASTRERRAFCPDRHRSRGARVQWMC